MADYAFVTNGQQKTFNFTGPFPAGTTILLEWDGVTVNSPCGRNLYQMNAYGDDVELLAAQTHPFGQGGAGSAQATLALPRAAVGGSFWTDSYCSTGTVHNLRFTSTFTGENCQYGTELSPGGVANIFVTAALLTSMATPFGWEWIVPFLGSAIGSWFNMAQICASPPPKPPPPGWDPRHATPSEISNAVLFILWYANCRCIPGTPAPVPFPPPSVQPPPNLTTPPPIVCSNTDLCALLTQMAELQRSMNATLTADHELVTLMQRYRLPFATIPGARHSGLTGDGALGVSRLIGVQIDIEDLAEPHRELEGVPKYIWDLGWVSAGTVAGMDEEQRVTRLAQLWFPSRMQEATTLGYHFKAGVTGAITELEAEP